MEPWCNPENPGHSSQQTVFGQVSLQLHDKECHCTWNAGCLSAGNYLVQGMLLRLNIRGRNLQPARGVTPALCSCEHEISFCPRCEFWEWESQSHVRNDLDKVWLCLRSETWKRWSFELSSRELHPQISVSTIGFLWFSMNIKLLLRSKAYRDKKWHSWRVIQSILNRGEHFSRGSGWGGIDMKKIPQKIDFSVHLLCRKPWRWIESLG